MEGKQRTKGQKSQLDGQHFISDDTCISFAELQSATMTKRKTTHHANQPYMALCEKTLKSLSARNACWTRFFAGKQKADVRGWSSAEIPEPTTCECTSISGCFWNANRKRKWNLALDSLSAKLFYTGLQWPHHRTKLNHFRSRWCNVV